MLLGLKPYMCFAASPFSSITLRFRIFFLICSRFRLNISLQRLRKEHEKERNQGGLQCAYDAPFDFMEGVAFLAPRSLVVFAVCHKNTFDAITSMLPMATWSNSYSLARLSFYLESAGN
jgi:hypothetical protein